MVAGAGLDAAAVAAPAGLAVIAAVLALPLSLQVDTCSGCPGCPFVVMQLDLSYRLEPNCVKQFKHRTKRWSLLKAA